MKMKTDCSPNRFRKYHDKLDTHRTSRSRVATPDWSIDLNRKVNGKGSFTVLDRTLASALDSLHASPLETLSMFYANPEDSLITKPAKKALIQLMINVCGIIMAMFPFIIPIIPSMAAGSVIGFPAGLPLLSGSFRNAPSLNADTR